MSEVTERFLRAVAERVPSDRVVTVFLFPAMRQGSVDSGVAVVVQDRDASYGGGAAPEGPHRLTVSTATYRHTVKGRERGAWAVDVVAQADAPLDAVAAVVAGVQRRSAAVAEPEELSGEMFRAIVAASGPPSPEVTSEAVGTA